MRPNVSVEDIGKHCDEMLSPVSLEDLVPLPPPYDKFDEEAEWKEINPKAGFKRFGLVRNDYLLISGSIQGTPKRMITLTKAVRLYEKRKRPLPTIETVAGTRGEAA